MATFRNIIIAYFILGAVMMGGGAVTYEEAGVPQFFIEKSDGQLSPQDGPQETTSGIGGQIKASVDSFAGGLMIIWELVTGLFSYMNWPIVVLSANNAPPMAILLLGGPPTAAFYGSVVGLIRSSA
jgi:hypothetical protein